ncbi:tripartite tricarboxylate transporter family receptor, partial [Bordetella hinzii L60]
MECCNEPPYCFEDVGIHRRPALDPAGARRRRGLRQPPHPPCRALPARRRDRRGGPPGR